MLRAKFESQLLDRMERLGREQALHYKKKKSVNIVTNQKDSCDVTSYPYAVPALQTHNHVKVEKTRSVVSSS